jgi:hypothetical protein
LERTCIISEVSIKFSRFCLLFVWNLDITFLLVFYLCLTFTWHLTYILCHISIYILMYYLRNMQVIWKILCSTSQLSSTLLASLLAHCEFWHASMPRESYCQKPGHIKNPHVLHCESQVRHVNALWWQRWSLYVAQSIPLSCSPLSLYKQ